MADVEVKKGTDLASQPNSIDKRKSEQTISTRASLTEIALEFIAEGGVTEIPVTQVISEPFFILAASGHTADGPGLRVTRLGERKQGPSVILKDFDADEHKFYERLWVPGAEPDPMQNVTPSFFGLRKEGDRSFLMLENLTRDFQDEKVMDVKVGARTFQEKEGLSKKPRPDMFKRALKLFPERLTAKQKEEESMTKFEFMALRDATTTIGTYAYRIDGVAGYSPARKECTVAKIKDAKSIEDNLDMLTEFATASATDEGRSQDIFASVVAREIHRQLTVLLEHLSGSRVFASHEFIGSSILFIADATGQVRVSWIDFAKTELVPEGIQITHEAEWIPGNHEDGIIRGVKGLIEAWAQVISRLPGSEAEPASARSAPRIETPKSSCRQMFDCFLCPGP